MLTNCSTKCPKEPLSFSVPRTPAFFLDAFVGCVFLSGPLSLLRRWGWYIDERGSRRTYIERYMRIFNLGSGFILFFVFPEQGCAVQCIESSRALWHFPSTIYNPPNPVWRYKKLRVYVIVILCHWPRKKKKVNGIVILYYVFMMMLILETSSCMVYFMQSWACGNSCNLSITLPI